MLHKGPRGASKVGVSLAVFFFILVLALWATPLLLGAEGLPWGPSRTDPAGQSTLGDTVPPTSTPVPTVIPASQITPVPTPTTAPGVTPVPSALTVVQPNVATTVLAAPQAQTQVNANFPAGTFSETRQVVVQDVSTAALATLPADVLRVSKAFEISVYLPNGTRVDQPRLNQCITITVPYTSADVTAAGNPFNLKIMRYDSATKAWVIYPTTVNVVQQTLTTQVCAYLSIFGISVAPQIPPTPTPSPLPTPTREPLKPYVGGVAPSSNVLLGLLVAGIVLILSGGYYLRRARR